MRATPRADPDVRNYLIRLFPWVVAIETVEDRPYLSHVVPVGTSRYPALCPARAKQARVPLG